MRRRRLGTALCSLALAVSGWLAPGAAASPESRLLRELRRYPYALVEIDRRHVREAVPTLALVGARRLTAGLPIWRLGSDSALRVLPELVRQGLVRAFAPDLPLRSDATFAPAEPLLIGREWWRSEIGADRAEPPGPGKPLTVIDSGLDLTHPDFANRPETVLLNPQHIDSREEFHGTAVASVAAAPSDAAYLVGVYPRALLQSWDTGVGLGSVIQGIDVASRRTPGVINLSLGTAEELPLLHDVVETAFRRGSLLVAAAGNDREIGSVAQYPASYAHVLTVAATRKDGAVTFFSNASPAVDLAAPGEGIAVDVPRSIDPAGYTLDAAGTSFATPMVSAAAAWIWTLHPRLTNTQVFDLLRFSARDVGQPGFDLDTGYGVLDIPKALAMAPPPPDPLEPNDDIGQVKPWGLFRLGSKIVTGPTHRRAVLVASLDQTEDREDVYRAWIPARGTLRVDARTDADVELQAWRNGTRSVFEQGRRRNQDLLAFSGYLGVPTETMTVRNHTSRAQLVYLEAFLGQESPRASYTLRLRVTAPSR